MSATQPPNQPPSQPPAAARTPAEPAAKSLTGLVAEIHDQGLTGEVVVEVPEGRRRLHFVDGELHFPSDHPLAASLEPVLEELRGEEESAGRGSGSGLTRGAGAAKLRALMTRIAFLLSGWSQQGRAAFRPAEQDTLDLVGPLPTALLLMEWAAAGDEEELIQRLGGEARWISLTPRRNRSAAAAARLVDPHAAVLLSRLSSPVSLDDLLRQSASPRSTVLADVARLQAAGLVELSDAAPGSAEAEVAPAPRPVAPRERSQTPATRGQPVSAPSTSSRPSPRPTSGARTAGTGVAPQPASKDVVHRYAEKVGRELESRPLALDAESHRSRLGDLLSRAAGLTAYELLGVEGTATGAEIHEGFQRLARLVHPSHADSLALAGGDRPLWFLFEQAVSAYLTLSQPERRRRYDERIQGLAASGARPAPRKNERQELARSYYERAEALLDAEDFHFAVELLKQAVHTHPRPEYYVLLGRAQAKNPNWLRHAMDSYRKAMDLGAEDSRIALALGRICEAMENYEEARRHYESALAKNPVDPDARAGIARLAGRQEDSEEAPRQRWSIGSLFRKR